MLRLLTLLSIIIFSSPSLKGKEATTAPVIDPNELKIEDNAATLRTFVVPIIKENQVIAYVMVDVKMLLSSTDNAVLEKIISLLPRARDSIFLYLYTLFGTLWVPGSQPNETIIAQKLLSLAQEHLGDTIKNLSLKIFEIHQLRALKGEDRPFFVPQIVNP